MMEERLVAAQIGCGHFARAQHGPNMVKNPNVGRIKWACDISEENATHYAEEFGAEQTSASFEDVCRDPEVDFIMVATSHEIHVPIVECAASHGKHIFCEKPMAMDERQAYDIIRAVRRHGVKLCVGYMRRCAPALVRLKEEWLKHKANPVRQPWRYVEVAHATLEEETCTDFLVRVQDESASYRMVHVDPFKGGGMIIGEGVHWLDLACWLFEGDRPVQIQAWGSARMRYGINMAFQSGNAVTITFTPNGSFDYPKEIYEIAHDGALFRNEFYVENQYYGRPGIENETFPLQRDSQPEVGKQGGLSGFLEKYRANTRGKDNSRAGFQGLRPNHGYEEILDGFIDAILHDAPVPCDELAGYRATYLGALAIQSINEGRPLPVPVDKWDYFVQV